MSVRRNTLINLVGYVVPMAVMLVTVPLYLKFLGDVRYGVLSLVWLILGYFSFLEMGLGKATANQIAKTHNAPDSVRSEIFWTAVFVNAFMGLFAACILWFIGDYLIGKVLEMPNQFRDEVLTTLPWLVSTLPLALISSVLNGALEGRNQFFVLNILQISTNVAFQVVPLIFIWIYSPSLAVVIPVAVITRAVMNIWFFRACMKTVPLKGKPAPTLGRMKLLFTYGGWVAITAAISPLLDTVERFIIGAVAGAAAVTHYTVPMQLVGKIKIIPGALGRALFPSFSSSDVESSVVLSSRALALLSSVMTLIVIVTLLLLRPFLELWIGEKIAAIATPIGEILLIGVWFNSIAHVPYFLLQAQGKPNVVAKLHILEIPIYIAALWWAMQLFGLKGVAVVWMLRCFVEAVALFYLGKLLFIKLNQLLLQLLVMCGLLYFLYRVPDISFYVRALIVLPFLLFAFWLYQKINKSLD